MRINWKREHEKQKAVKSLLIIAAVMLMSIGLNAQSQQLKDTEPTNSYSEVEVLDIWKDWHAKATQDNAYVGEFMEENKVPEKGSHGLNREETWYWWISNHPDEIAEFMALHKKHKSN